MSKQLLRPLFNWLICLLFLIAFWANFGHIINLSLVQLPINHVLAQDEDDDEEFDFLTESVTRMENCPIGAVFDEIQLEDGCIERRFYQAGTIEGCQVSEPVLACPTGLGEPLACDPNSNWSVVAAGCDDEGFFYEIRYNLCNGLIEPYHNPRKVAGLCQKPIADRCQTNDQFNNFIGCQQTECGVTIFACDSDNNQQREYEDGGDICFQSQFNQACTDLEDEEEEADDEGKTEIVTPSPAATLSQPTVTFSPSPTPAPRPLTTPSPTLSLTAQVKGKLVDLNSLEAEIGQPINFTVQVPNRSLQDLICQWNLDEVVDGQGQPLLLETSCNLTETFHADSLNLGMIRVSASVFDKTSRQPLGQVRPVKFKVKDPYPDDSCSSGSDPQIIKQCIIKQAKLDKEPRSGKPLSNLMLCLLDQEGVPSLLGTQPATTNSLFEQVSLLKLAILRGETDLWTSYPLCLNR